MLGARAELVFLQAAVVVGKYSGGGSGGCYLDASATDTILLSGLETGNGLVTISK